MARKKVGFKIFLAKTLWIFPHTLILMRVVVVWGGGEYLRNHISAKQAVLILGSGGGTRSLPKVTS